MRIAGGSRFDGVSSEESFHGHCEPQRKVKQRSSPDGVLLEANLGFSNEGTLFSGAQFLLCPEKENGVYALYEQDYIEGASTSINEFLSLY